MLNAFRVARSRFRRGVLVLLYHRVAELCRDPWSLCVSPVRFEQHLAVVRDRTWPIRLQHIGPHLTAGTLRRPRVAVTFDDGYSDNLHQAEPLLRHAGIPAAIFVVSGALRWDREFWWDELDRIVFESGPTGAPIKVKLKDETFTWIAPDNSGAGGRDAFQAWTGNRPTAAHRAYAELHERLVRLRAAERTAILDEIVNQLALPKSPRSTHRPLSRSEISALASSPVIDIGVHTVTHPILAELNRAEQTSEISEAKAELESATGRRLTLFSYPYGKREHYNDETMDIVRSSGFEYAFVNEPGIADEYADHLQMPRVVVPPLDGREFSAWLTHCLATLA